VSYDNTSDIKYLKVHTACSCRPTTICSTFASLRAYAEGRDVLVTLTDNSLQ